jgi:hypothetical protein
VGGPYVSERQWGTVREDYSADGNAWAYLPHDHARSRAYRWGEVHYAKAGPDDLLMSIQVTNSCPEADTLHVLPTAWFRNTWSWGDDEPRPGLRASGDRSVTIDHPFAGAMELIAAAGPGDAGPQLLLCENDTNLATDRAATG